MYYCLPYWLLHWLVGYVHCIYRLILIWFYTSDAPTDKFGQALKAQVEERLAFYDSGATPEKNIDVMKKVIDSLDDEEIEETPVESAKGM